MKKILVCKNSNKFFIFSIALILVGVIFLFVNGLNFGIDFVGGTIINIDLKTTFETSEIREITNKYDSDCVITTSGDTKHEVVISSKKDFSAGERTDILNAFKAKYNITDKELLSFDKVSPTIGKELQNQSFVASAITVVLILIYVTIRFEFLYAVAAIIALVHDLLIVLSVYAVFKIPVNSSFIAAMLTILGYSINDTIVVFDRIRENRKKYTKFDYENLIDDSINQTMTRSINTTLTTLLAVGSLYVLGVSSIKEFALPMLIGFVSGVYSSIFIASAIWYKIKNAQANSIKNKISS